MTTIADSATEPTTTPLSIHAALEALDVDFLVDVALSFAAYRDRGVAGGAPLMAGLFGAIAAEAIKVAEVKVDDALERVLS